MFRVGLPAKQNQELALGSTRKRVALHYSNCLSILTEPLITIMSANDRVIPKVNIRAY